MKCAPILTALLLLTLSATAADYRLWFDAKTQKSITAEIVDKKLDNSQVKVHIKGGKTLWIKTARLVEEDVTYVKSWVKPVDHLAVRVIGHKRGGIKKIKITAKSGGKDMKVAVYKSAGFSRFITEILKAGETREIIAEVNTDYVVKAFEGGTDVHGNMIWGNMVEQETHRKKTGL